MTGMELLSKLNRMSNQDLQKEVVISYPHAMLDVKVNVIVTKVEVPPFDVIEKLGLLAQVIQLS